MATKKKAAEQAQKDHEGVCELIKKVVGDKLDKVEVSNQIVQSPCVLVAPQFGQTANMERIMKAQALQSQEQRMMMNPAFSRKTMLINVEHKLIKWFRDRVATAGSAEKAAEDKHVTENVRLLYDTALLSSGFGLDDPNAVASRVQKLMISKL